MSETTEPLRLWRGHTMHARFRPFENRFRYAIAMVDVDIDRLAEAGRVSRHFGIDRPALFSLRLKEHGPRDGSSLRTWAEAMLATAGVDARGLQLRLVSFPRHLFYRFAPITLWLALAQDGGLRGIIYEVNNTFGETHCYAAAADGARSEHTADKRFHVSPFFDVSGRYRFTVREPGRTLDVVVDNIEAGERLHMANIKARALAATDAAFLRLALQSPFSSLGVSAGIHWQALKLFLRGARYRPKPEKPAEKVTIAKGASS